MESEQIGLSIFSRMYYKKALELEKVLNRQFIEDNESYFVSNEIINDEIIANYLYAIELNNYDAILGLAKFYKSNDDYKNMIKYCLMSIEYEQNCNAIMILGDYYKSINKRKSIKYYKMVIEDKKTNKLSLISIAMHNVANNYKEITDCLSKYKNNNINDENYLRELSIMNFKSTNATHLLIFLETCINTDLHTVPLEYTLEHIYCQKEKATLVNQSLMNNIGNLTLLEGKNSINGHKGNSSIGCKSYGNKKKSYEESNSKVTRDIAEKYETFEEKNIIERSKFIVSELNKYTNY